MALSAPKLRSFDEHGMTPDPDRKRRTLLQFLLTAALTATAMAGTVLAQTPASPPVALPERIAAFAVVADGIPDAIAGLSGDASRGRALIVARDPANCVLCHAVSDPGVPFFGNLAPSLDGVGRRRSIAQLRLRVVDYLRLDPATVMPSYYRVEGLAAVAGAYRGKPILDAGQVEDVVAYLATLR